MCGDELVSSGLSAIIKPQVNLKMTNNLQTLIFAILLSNYGSGSLTFEMNKCRQHDIKSLLSQRDDDSHKCRPRKVTVELNTRDTWPGHALLAPTHLEVARCVGSCGHYFHSCYPTSSRSILVPVIMSEITVKEGVTDTTCGHVEMEEHLTCGCGCDVTEDTCTENQMFLQFECRCVCNNHNERDTCLSRGWRWDRDSCTCQCPGAPYPTCPSGYVYDFLKTCGCVAIHNEASTEIVTLFVIAFALFLSSVVTGVSLFISKSFSNKPIEKTVTDLRGSTVEELQSEAKSFL